MSNKIFRSVFFSSMLTLCIGLVMVFNVLFDYFEGQIFAELATEADYIAVGIKDNAKIFFNSFKSDSKRITLIAPDGTVLADTKVSSAKLENHSDREEIKDAVQNGTGKSSRYSHTLTEKTLYYSQRLENGNILRVSTTQNSKIIILLGLIQPITVIIFIVLALSLFLSYKVANSITKPINAIDPNKPDTACTYDELTPLLNKLATQKKTINYQIKEAQKSREEFRLICENMNEGFLIIDKDSKILSYNDSALKILETKNIKSSNVLSYNRSKDFRDSIEKVLEGNRAESTLHIRDKIYDLIANPVYLSDNLIGAVLVLIDITESSKREQLRREFTSNVSHELKTPLTSISGFAEIMKTGDTAAKIVADFSTSIYDEAQRLIALVNDIIKISELDEGLIPHEIKEENLYIICKDILNRLEPIAKKQGITLTLHGDNTFVLGVEKILNEMLYNLCDNAIKYNKPNGTVDVFIASTKDSVKLTVKDSGIGIPPTEQSRIFERFYRVDKSRSKSAGGTGLGLAIVKHGAIYHNAKIELQSIPDNGTSVTLIFNKPDHIQKL